MAEGGEIGGGVLGADAAFVIAEGHVHDPVEAVLDRPVGADDRAEQFGEQDERGDVEAGLVLDLVVGRSCAWGSANAVDHDDCLEAGPVVALLQPADVVEDGGGPGLDAAVVGIDGLALADCAVGEVAGLLLGDEELHVVVQRTLVALQGEHVVGLLVDDRLGDVALAAHGIDGHDGAFDRQHVEQLRDSADLVGLLRHLDLAEHQALPRGEGRDHVDRRLGAALLVGSARGLAVGRDHLGRRARERGDPGDEAALELLGIERCEDVAEMVMRRRAVAERPGLSVILCVGSYGWNGRTHRYGHRQSVAGPAFGWARGRRHG